MWNLCSIKTIAANSRWPTPMKNLVADVDFLVTCGHEEFSVLQKAKQANKAATTPESFLDVLRLLASALDDLEAGREAGRETWWASPAKRALRQRLDKEGDQMKLSELHRINNTTEQRIETMYAKLGSFVKWSVGLEGGIAELEDGFGKEKTETSDPEEVTKSQKRG